jgi:RNA methyltransferase, TrmH family
MIIFLGDNQMIIEISSKENEKIKYTKSLLKSKTRHEENKYIIEGYRIITQALESNANIDYIIFNDDFSNKKEFMVVDTLKSRNIPIYKTTNKLFKDLVDTENTQGILAVINTKENNLNDLIKDETKFVVVLDRIQDPGNMGTIIRTADASGVDLIITLKGSVDIYNPKVIRSTMGSIFNMKTISLNEEDVIKILKDDGFNIVSSYLDTDNYYTNVDYGSKVALVIGNEANGINDNIIKNSDILVKIPIYGSAESLNAAISAGILMYEIKKYLV